MKNIVRSERKVSMYTVKNVNNEKLEMLFIIDFLKQLPLNYLKEITNFKKIDFKDKNSWSDAREDTYLLNKLNHLIELDCIEYNCEKYIDIE